MKRKTGKKKPESLLGSDSHLVCDISFYNTNRERRNAGSGFNISFDPTFGIHLFTIPNPLPFPRPTAVRHNQTVLEENGLQNTRSFKLIAFVGGPHLVEDLREKFQASLDS